MVYYCKDYKNITRDENFFRADFLLVFQALQVLSLSLRLESSISLNIRNFLRVGFSYFLSLESYFCEIYVFYGFPFLKYKKVPFPEIYEVFLGFPFLEMFPLMILEKFTVSFAFNLRKESVTDFSFIFLTENFVLCL